MKPHCVDSRQESSSPSLSRSLRQDLLSILVICSCLVAYFWRTVFSAQSISRLSLLPEWDSIFNQFRTGLSGLYDPSLLQIFLPNYFLIAQTFAKGQLPLWNPYSGLGCPLIGDIQTSVFSPLRILFDFFPSLYTYNLFLIFELIVSAVSTYLFVRLLKVSPIPSLFAALIYVFCPFNLWYLELNTGSSSCLIPLTFLFFGKAGLRPSLVAALLAGISASLLIISGHPESSFFGISFASFFMLILIFTDKTRTTKASFLLSLKSLFIAATATICFSAPILFPFIEYLLNSETYKYVSVCSAHVPWQGIIVNLFNPALGPASPYLGIITLITCLFSICKSKDSAEKGSYQKSLWLLALICFLIVSQLGPIELLFCKAPFTAIITRYGLPVLLLILSALAAFGLEKLVGGKLSNRSIFILGILAILSLLFPYLIKNNADWLKSCNFELMLNTTAINISAWKRDIYCAGIFFILILLGQKIQKIPRSFILVACLIVGLLSEISAGKDSLPAQSNFSYPKVETLSKITNSSYRCITCNDHILKPGSNMVYGINQLQVHNPLFPQRFLSFLRACNAQVDLFNQKFSKQISPLLNLASVKYILSDSPIQLSTEPSPNGIALNSIDNQQASFEKNIILNKASFWYDAVNASAGGKLSWSDKRPVNLTKPLPQLSFSLVLFNQKDQALWFSDQILLNNEYSFSIPVPSKIPDSSGLKLGLQVFDPTEIRFLKADISSLPKIENSIIIQEFLSGQGTQNSESTLKLIEETGSRTRLYENTKALPRAYIVSKAIFSPSKDESLKAIQNPSFNPETTVVIESQKQNWLSKPDTSNSYKSSAVSLIQKEPDQINLRLSKSTNGYLVLTDIFYPGWKVLVDGKEREILRANYLFRAIRIFPSDKLAVFSYQPLSFLMGCWVFLAFNGLVLVLLLVKKVKENKLAKSS